MNKVFIVNRIVSGVSRGPYYHHCQMWKHIGAQGVYSASEQYDTGAPPYGAGQFAEGPRKSPRDILNAAVRLVKGSETTHMFVLDDDIICPPNIVDLLLLPDKPIVGALIHRNDGSPLVWERHFDGERPMYGHPATGVFPCHAVALGAMMIKREVLEALSDPWFFFERNGRTMDVNFCREARAAGFESWCSVDAACKQLLHDEREI